MMKQYLVGGMILVVIVAVAGAFASWFYGSSFETAAQIPTAPTEVTAHPFLNPSAFVPPDPEQAPAPIHNLVLDGYYILMDTRMHAPRYVSPQTGLSCRNCHFEGGRARDSVSLVGVATQYPRPSSDPNAPGLVTLAHRIQYCFVNNLGGQAPPENSPVMQAVAMYLSWISKDLPLYGSVPWLGLPPLETPEPPHPQQGLQVFAGLCSRCHGPEGQGGGLAPPLWGSGSFTTGSSMAREPILASFVWRFMPYRRPNLEPQQATAAAAFVLSQPRRAPGAQVPPLPRMTTAPGPPLPVPESMPYEEVPPEMRSAGQLQQAARELVQMGVAQMPGPQAGTPHPAPLAPRQAPPAPRPAQPAPGQTQPTTVGQPQPTAPNP